MTPFFSGQPSNPFHLSLGGYLSVMITLLLLVVLSFRYYDRKKFQRIFKLLQWVQIIFLYTWYAYHRLPLSESLPLYHCRIAMFVLLLLSDQVSFKCYFALLGLCGSLLAIVYPIFDPFPFWHLATFSYLLGHYALVVNALVYLLNDKSSSMITESNIVAFTAGLNALLIIANTLTGGNYGFLRQSPIINNHNLLINYVLVTLVLSMILIGLNQLLKGKTREYLTH